MHCNCPVKGGLNHKFYENNHINPVYISYIILTSS
jgi:hypothetical protein